MVEQKLKKLQNISVSNSVKNEDWEKILEKDRRQSKFNWKEISAVVAKEGMKVGIIASRFNEIIVNKLLGGAVDGLVRHGVEEDNITAAWVPGAFEIPLAADKMACSGKYDAVICVGAVIRGDTTHYDYVCNEVSKGLHQYH